jgi:hypothetical protein
MYLLSRDYLDMLPICLVLVYLSRQGFQYKNYVYFVDIPYLNTAH